VALAAMLAAAASAVLSVSVILIIRYWRRHRASSADQQSRQGPGSKFYETLPPRGFGSVTSKLSKPEAAAAVAAGSGS